MLYKLCILLLILPLSYLDAAQTADCPGYYHPQLKKTVYTEVDIEPEFPGGAAAYQRFLNKNLRLTDEMIEDENTQLEPRSKVIFIVDTSGRISHPIVHNQQDTSQLEAFEKEILRLLRLMPAWTPGKCHGKTVAVQVNRQLFGCILLERS